MGDFSTIQQYGVSGRVYQFPNTIRSWRDNFKKLRMSTVQLPMMAGGLDQYGSSPAPSEVGEVKVSFLILADSPQQMQTKKDDLYELAAWGKLPLFLQPYDHTLNRRWANARVKSIEVDENAEICSWANQTIDMVFEVPEARWNSYPSGSTALLWGSPGTIWGDPGFIWGGSAGVAFSGPGPLEINVDYRGTAQVPAIIQLVCGAGQSIVNPVVSRYANLVEVERVKFNGTIPQNSIFIIDSTKLSGSLNGNKVYNSLEIKRSTWISLEPRGTSRNSIRISSDGGSDAGTAKIRYTEGYY